MLAKYALSLFIVVFSAPTYAETVIDMTDKPDILYGRVTLSLPEGQTFIVPATDTFLSSLTYYIGGGNGLPGGNGFVSVDLYGWNQNALTTTGSVLWSSGQTPYSNSPPLAQLNFSPDINLASGGFYALVFTATPYSTGYFLLSHNNYAGGTAIISLTPNEWQAFTQFDAPLVMTFDAAPSTTPLPAALPLFSSGLGALCLLGWRRKRKNVAIAA